MDAKTQISDVQIIELSKLFDVDWYLQQYPEIEIKQLDPLTHFYELGWKEGYKPNAYFDPAWYSRTYADELEPQHNPLLHYIKRGERENAWPSPHFDPEWYRDIHGLGEHDSPLRHFLVTRLSGRVSPLPSFDVFAHVKAHREVKTLGLDPYLHHLEMAKGRLNPLAASAFGRTHGIDFPKWEALMVTMTDGKSVVTDGPLQVDLNDAMTAIKLLLPWLPFDADWYAQAYPDVAEAVAQGAFESVQAHFIHHGFFEGRSPLPMHD